MRACSDWVLHCTRPEKSPYSCEFDGRMLAVPAGNLSVCCRASFCFWQWEWRSRLASSSRTLLCSRARFCSPGSASQINSQECLPLTAPTPWFLPPLPGRGCAGHLVQLRPVPLLHAGLAAADRARPRPLLSHLLPGDGQRHPLLLGGAHGHDGPAAHRPRALPHRVPALHGARAWCRAWCLPLLGQAAGSHPARLFLPCSGCQRFSAISARFWARMKNSCQSYSCRTQCLHGMQEPAMKQHAAKTLAPLPVSCLALSPFLNLP